MERTNRTIRLVASIKNDNCLPPFDISILDTIPILKKNEIIQYAIPVILKEIRMINLGYVGGSQGSHSGLLKVYRIE